MFALEERFRILEQQIELACNARVWTHYSHQMTAAARAIAAMKFFDVAVEAGGYTAPVLEAAKHALDDVALPVVSVRKVIESYESDVIQGWPWQIEDEADVDSRKPRLL